MQKERHRDGFWRSSRWSQYATPIPRVYHKMELIKTLRTEAEYNWDEKATRKYERGLAQWLRD